MKAIRLHDHGGTDSFRYDDVPRPEPEAEELRVRVRAAGVNPIDWLVGRGELTDLLDESLPWIPGWDLSGVVESAGSDVTRFDPGDAVYGMVRLPGAGGTFAEYTAVRAEEVAAKPETLTHAEAAAVPMVGQTARHALFEEAGLEPNQRVLVHAAAGGVGHMAVQFAAAADAQVVGTASGTNEEFLRDLGVDEFVDYRQQQFERVVEPVDVVLDCVGGEVLERSGDVVRRGGVVVTLPDAPPDALVERFDQRGIETRFFSVTSDSDPATLRRVTDLIDEGTVVPTISDVYPLAEARQALEESAAGHVRGKLVLDVGGTAA